MSYIYPDLSSVMLEAGNYANDSIDFTADYSGWEDKSGKHGRIVRGRAIQLWLVEFCKVNGINHIKDISSAEVPDEMDLAICGKPVDCKASVLKGVCQVTTNISNQSGKMLYFFFETDKELSYIKPLGAVSKNKFKDAAILVKKGDKIPGTDIIQKFGSGSYFIATDFLYPFESAIDCLCKNKRNISREDRYKMMMQASFICQGKVSINDSPEWKHQYINEYIRQVYENQQENKEWYESYDSYKTA